MVILVTALKQISGHTQTNQNVTAAEIFSLFTEQNLKMENFGIIFILAHVVSLTMYFLIGGFLHVSFIFFISAAIYSLSFSGALSAFVLYLVTRITYSLICVT